MRLHEQITAIAKELTPIEERWLECRSSSAPTTTKVSVANVVLGAMLTPREHVRSLRRTIAAMAGTPLRIGALKPEIHQR